MNDEKSQQDQVAFQQQDQVQLGAQDQIKVEIFKNQIDSLFDIFDQVINYVKSGNVEQNQLVSYNDVAVASLKLFGKGCERQKKKNKFNILKATYAHFDEKRSVKNNVDAKILKFWFEYVDCALTSNKPLKQLKITKQAIEYAKDNTSKMLPDFLSALLSANHQVSDMVNNVRINAAQYKQQHDAAIKRSQQSYINKQNTVQYPSQNDMYNVSGGGKNLQYASALHSFGKYAKNQVNNNENDNKNNDSDMLDKSQNNNNNNNKSNPNGYIIEQPPQQLLQNGKAINIQYPFPCQIIRKLDNKTFGVQLAEPYRDVRARIDMSNVEDNRNLVHVEEQKYIQQRNNGQGLGYKSVQEQQQQEQNINWQ
eukprot:194794_1